jgi:hypothetical protein
MNNKFHAINLDFLGISASLLCAIHCAVLPVIISISAVSHQGHLWHQVMDFIFLPIAILLIVYSLLKSIQKHQQKSPAIIAITGLLLFFAGKLFFHHPHFIFTTLGGIAIAFAHFQNWVFLKRLAQKKA